MMFGSDGPAEQQQHSGGAGRGGGGPGPPASGASEGERLHSRRPCLSQAGANPHHVPCASSACRTRMPPPPPQAALVVIGESSRGQIGRRDAGKRFCRCHHHFPPSHFLILLLFSYMVPWWWCREASAIGELSPTTLLSSSQTQDARLRAATATPPKFRSPGLHLETLRDPSFKTRIHFIYSLSSFSHMCPFRRSSISMRYIS
jgi:hypothetical protein